MGRVARPMLCFKPLNGGGRDVRVVSRRAGVVNVADSIVVPLEIVEMVKSGKCEGGRNVLEDGGVSVVVRIAIMGNLNAFPEIRW